MTLATMRTYVATVLGERTDLDDEIDICINDAIQEICTQIQIPALITEADITSVEDQTHYDLEDDCYAVLSVQNDDDNVLLERVRMFEFDNIDESVTGTPTKYARDGDQIILFDSVPDDTDFTIKVRYWKLHPVLDSDSEDHVLGRLWERGIRELAVAHAYTLINSDKAQVHMAEYRRWLGHHQRPEAIEDGHSFESRLYFG